jgi:phosphoribosylformimino-5-aminoimidazole carboxamide ribotide isomerase
MLVIPAIDLRGGRCVRLFQGDFARETRYSDDPVAVAEKWIESGAELLHVVDLDGARAGQPVQLDIVARIAELGVPVELGGGLRTLDDVAAALDAGVARVVIGTAAIENPRLLADAVEQHGAERVVLGVDARGGYVATRGWETVSEARAIDIVRDAGSVGVRRVIYTDIERDGTLSAPNYVEIDRVAGIGPSVIASGGVAEWSHLERLAAIPNVEAAIVGRALYDGTVLISAPDQWRVSRQGRL